MKKALLLGMLLCLLFAGRALAAYNFSINASGGTINATLSGATNSTSSFHLVVQTTNNFPTTPPASLQPITNSFDATGQTIQKPNAQGVVTWNLSGTPGTTYYARVVEIPTPANYVTVNQSASPSYVTAVQSVTPAYLPVPINPLTSKLDGTNIIVSGSIDTTKVSFDPTQYTATLVYTPTVPASTVTTLTGTPAGPAKIAADGTYSWTLIGLNPNTTYYFQQTVTQVGNTNNPTVDTINHFNTATGNTVQGTSPSAAETAQESYTFLSDPTGATIFPDPDLCAQEQQQAQANGKTPPKCGLNDYLNLALSFLIGLSGVVLVLKLMWVGFEYMTTDLPFKKAGAKGQFITSLLGLLLVMTSYIILNTINPKLVNESIDVQQLNIGLAETSLDSGTFQSVTGEALETQSQYSSLADTISKQQGIDSCIVKATIQVESDWDAAAIGCDEDSPYNIASRRAYLQSGINYDGTTFTPTTNVSSSQMNHACTFDPSKPGFGLDWRFSKGGGLMQVTIFPTGYKTQAWYAGVKQGGSYWNSRTTPYTGWQTLLKPEGNITQGIALLKEYLSDCKGSVEGAFREYQSGSCTGTSTLIDATVAKKMALYNSCESGSSTPATGS